MQDGRLTPEEIANLLVEINGGEVKGIDENEFKKEVVKEDKKESDNTKDRVLSQEEVDDLVDEFEFSDEEVADLIQGTLDSDKKLEFKNELNALKITHQYINGWNDAIDSVLKLFKEKELEDGGYW